MEVPNKILVSFVLYMQHALLFRHTYDRMTVVLAVSRRCRCNNLVF